MKGVNPYRADQEITPCKKLEAFKNQAEQEHNKPGNDEPESKWCQERNNTKFEYDT